MPPPATVSMIPPPVAVSAPWAVVDAGAADVDVPHAPVTDVELNGSVGSASQSAAEVTVLTTVVGSQEAADASPFAGPEAPAESRKTTANAAAGTLIIRNALPPSPETETKCASTDRDVPAIPDV